MPSKFGVKPILDTSKLSISFHFQKFYFAVSWENCLNLYVLKKTENNHESGTDEKEETVELTEESNAEKSTKDTGDHI